MDFLLLSATAAALFGAIVGSFINALSFRFGTGRSVVVGRSRCMRCGRTLSVAELVPVLSWLLLRGRCRHCGSRISVQYPLVEAAAALLSLGVYLLYPQPVPYFFWTFVWMLLLFVVVYDLRHTIIPWTFSLMLIASSLVALVCAPHLATHDLLAGPLLALPLLLIALLSRGRAMGWGDGVLELGLGGLLGLTAGLTALLLAVWIGAGVGIALMVWGRGVTMKTEMPFAPFLILGAAVVFFFNVDFFQTLPLLFS